MKKSILFALAAMFCIPAFFSFAPPTGTPHGIIVKARPVSAEKSFVLRMANLQHKPARILIHDAQGNTYFSDKVLDHNGYRMLIDVRHLDSGEYLLQIYHPEESITGTIKVTPNSAEVIWDNGELAGKAVNL